MQPEVLVNPITSRFMNAFDRLNAPPSINTTINRIEQNTNPYKYVAVDVTRQFDIANNLVPVPNREDIQPFLTEWEAKHSDELCLFMQQSRDSTLFEWVLYEILLKENIDLQTIVAEREKYTMAFSGRVIIKVPNLDIAINVLAILMKIQQETPNMFTLARLRIDIPFPTTYNMFAIEYSMSLARMSSDYGPINTQKMAWFCKPMFCLQYYLIPVPGHVLGDTFTEDKDLLYLWSSELAKFELYAPTEQPIRISKTGLKAQNFHNIQASFLNYIMGKFGYERRYLQNREANLTEQEVRKIRLFKKITCWAESWLFYDFGILAKFAEKDKFKSDYPQAQNPNQSTRRPPTNSYFRATRRRN